MKYTLRQAMVWCAILCFLLAVFRRPLRYLFSDRPEWISVLFTNILDPFRHLAWLAGWDVQYAGAGEGNWIGTEVLGQFFGAILSLVVHVILFAIVAQIAYDCCYWAKHGAFPDRADTPKEPTHDE